MIDKFKNNPHLSYFILYSITMMLEGCMLTTPGPIIPFLSSKYSIPETQFTFIFSSRSAGVVLGCILTRYFSGKLQIHTMQSIATLCTSISFILFPFTNSLFLQGFYFFVNGAFCATFEILISISVVKAYQGNDEEFWLQLVHAMFGIGGLLGPIFVRLWGEYGCVCIGVLTLFTFPAYIKYKSPEVLEEEKDVQENKDEVEFKTMSKLSSFLLMAIFFVYMGEETGFAGWVSPYVVMLNLENKEGATKYPAIFWIFMTVFRFVFAGASGSISKRLISLNKFKLFVEVISILLTVMGYTLLAVYWNSVLLGVALSSMFALIFTICIEFKQSISQAQAASVMMFSAFGDGSLPTVIGYIMKLLGPFSLFYCQIFMGILNFALILFLIKDLEKNEPNDLEKGTELKQRLNQ